MIAGGYNGTEKSTVEVLGELDKDCNLPNLPFAISYVPSLINHGTNILLCGGQNNEKQCLRLDDEKWVHYNELNKKRTCASAINTNGATHIFGGRESKINRLFLYVTEL